MHKLVPEDEKGHLLVGLMRTRITLTSSGWVRLGCTAPFSTCSIKVWLVAARV